ncbi:MAG: hypothetical protein ACRCXB_26385 [Aeromonadaceae bacterium]
MDFKVRDELCRLLNDDMTAFKLASEWVDSADKLAVFTRKYNETAQHIAQEQRVGLALPIAKKLWDECYEPPAV